jgi:hypothetical protein
VGLDHRNLASQSVFEPWFDLTVVNESDQHRYALKHILVTIIARAYRVALRACLRTDDVVRHVIPGIVTLSPDIAHV